MLFSIREANKVLPKMKFNFFFCLIFVLNLGSKDVLAQSPKVEIRAVWVATVSNLDWPRGDNRFDKSQQQSTMIAMLDSAVSWNLNTIFLQIRPQSDAFYESELAPWSEYVSGTRGTSPGYDPLAFAITEAHKRGLELHGWLNPYRYETFKGKNDGKPGDYNATHPEWMLNYEDDRIFNPGVPGVRQHLKEIVGEIVNNYDIDGIHFDDYFYPYSGTGSQDQATFDTYGTGFDNIGDWRRNNVNQMIADVYDTIQQVRSYVRFGVSPFGIYGNGQNPSGISGLDAYNSIFTDPIQWMSSGNIDYICPQLYWPTGGSQDFSTLLPWWAQQANDNNRHVIAGHGVYRLANNAATAMQSSLHENNLHENKIYFNDTGSSRGRIQADAWTLSQVVLQIDIVRDNRSLNAMGGAFFRYQDFIRVDGLVEYLKGTNYGSPALMPSMPWKNQASPPVPSNIRWEENDTGVSYITWDSGDTNLRYVVYSSDQQAPDEAFFDNPSNIIKILYDTSFFLNESSTEGNKPYLFISSYDRFGNESVERASFSIEAPSDPSTLLSPMDLVENRASQFEFTWTSVPNAQSYVLEISSNSDFSTIDFTSIVFANSTNTSDIDLLGNHQYYWRVTPFNLFGDGPVSSVFAFKTGFPSNPELISPVDDQDLIETLPLIKWSDDGLSTTAKLQISKGGSQFEPFNIVTDVDLAAVSEYQVMESLNEWTTYHLRLKSLNDLGESHWVPVSFKTLISLPEAPIIYTPTSNNDEHLEGEIITAKWGKTSLANGYQMKLTSDQNAESVIEEKNFFSANDTTYSFSNLLPGIYYFNVAGNNVGGNGAWSQALFEIDRILSVEKFDSKSKNLSYTVSESGSTLILVDTRELKNYRLKIYSLDGKEIKLSKPYYQNQSELVFDLGNTSLHKVGVVVLETEDGVQSLKIFNNGK